MEDWWKKRYKHKIYTKNTGGPHHPREGWIKKNTKLFKVLNMRLFCMQRNKQLLQNKQAIVRQ